jgi:antitoxin HicB
MVGYKVTMQYPVSLKHVDGVVMVTCADIPEFATVGDDAADALRNALDGIETALMGYMSDRRKIPASSKAKRGQKRVTLPALAVAKIGLYEAMLAKKLRKADLARLLDVHMPQVDRLLDLRHSTKIDQVEYALNLLGRRIELSVLAA